MSHYQYGAAFFAYRQGSLRLARAMAPLVVLPIYFLGGVQLLCAGVLGEYVGKIYMEIKAIATHLRVATK